MNFNDVMNQLNAMRAADGGALGAVLAIVIEGLLFARDGYDTFRDEYDALKKRVSALEDKINRPPILSLTLSAFQRAIRTQITTANLAAQAGLGTSPTVALTTSGGTGEISTIRRFLLSLTVGSSPAAGTQVRLTPPTTIVGPISVRLSPSTGSTGGSIFDNDPYFSVGYASDGKTVSYIDIGANAALTAAAVYGLQVEVDEVDTSSNISSMPVVLSN